MTCHVKISSRMNLGNFGNVRARHGNKFAVVRKTSKSSTAKLAHCPRIPGKRTMTTITIIAQYENVLETSTPRMEQCKHNDNTANVPQPHYDEKKTIHSTYNHIHSTPRRTHAPWQTSNRVEHITRAAKLRGPLHALQTKRWAGTHRDQWSMKFRSLPLPSSHIARAYRANEQ